MIAFKTSSALCTPPVTASHLAYLSVKDGNPMQPKQQFFRRAQRQAGNHTQVFDIEIRLVKAVK